MRDLITHIKGTPALAQGALAGQTRGVVLDALGSNALSIFVTVAPGATLDANNYYAVSLEETDADVNGAPVAAGWMTVPAAKMFGQLSVNAADATFKVGTSASLHRFLRLVLTPVGTPTGATVSAFAVFGHLQAEGFGWANLPAAT
jgi:hypothetical protein